MADLVTVEDIEVLLGRSFGQADTARAGALVTYASALALQVAGADVTWTVADAPEAVKAVVCQMVIRAFDNPRGLTGETIGSYNWQANNAAAAAGIYMLRAERVAVRRAAGVLGIGSVQMESDLLPLEPYAGGLLLPSDGV